MIQPGPADGRPTAISVEAPPRSTTATGHDGWAAPATAPWNDRVASSVADRTRTGAGHHARARQRAPGVAGLPPGAVTRIVGPSGQCGAASAVSVRIASVASASFPSEIRPCCSSSRAQPEPDAAGTDRDRPSAVLEARDEQANGVGADVDDAGRGPRGHWHGTLRAPSAGLRIPGSHCPAAESPRSNDAAPSGARDRGASADTEGVDHAVELRQAGALSGRQLRRPGRRGRRPGDDAADPPDHRGRRRMRSRGSSRSSSRRRPATRRR